MDASEGGLCWISWDDDEEEEEEKEEMRAEEEGLWRRRRRRNVQSMKPMRVERFWVALAFI